MCSLCFFWQKGMGEVAQKQPQFMTRHGNSNCSNEPLIDNIEYDQIIVPDVSNFLFWLDYLVQVTQFLLTCKSLLFTELPWVDCSYLLNLQKKSWKNFFAYLGPGFLVSIAYIDPGNCKKFVMFSLLCFLEEFIWLS